MGHLEVPVVQGGRLHGRLDVHGLPRRLELRDQHLRLQVGIQVPGALLWRLHVRLHEPGRVRGFDLRMLLEVRLVALGMGPRRELAPRPGCCKTRASRQLSLELLGWARPAHALASSSVLHCRGSTTGPPLALHTSKRRSQVFFTMWRRLYSARRTRQRAARGPAWCV